MSNWQNVCKHVGLGNQKGSCKGKFDKVTQEEWEQKHEELKVSGFQTLIDLVPNNYAGWQEVANRMGEEICLQFQAYRQSKSTYAPNVPL